MNSNTIKNWSEDERPREKLIFHGAHTLSDSELLAIIINHGTREKSALALAKEVLNDAQNDWAILSRKSTKDLQKISGIGLAKSISILATMEIANRKQFRMSNNQEKSITSSNDAAEILIPILRDYPHEVFYLLLLNQKNKIIHKQILSTGGITAAIVDVRMLMKIALEHLATAMIISHNHPSGNLNPSNADKSITQKIKNAGEIMDIKLLDHIIIGDNSYYSFADNGIL